jgi:cell division protein FtsA
MARHIAAGIDIGTYNVRVVIAELLNADGKVAPKIIGTGHVESKGLRHGYIVNSPEVTRCLRSALEQAQKTAGTQIKRAYLSIGGVGLASFISQGSAVITRADAEVTELDVSKTLEHAERDIPSGITLNRKIIHAIPLSYKIDGKQVLGRPQGMKGTKLESRVLFITCLEQHLNDLVGAVNDAGIEIDDVMASPLAASLVTLTKAQKIAGCILANIGAETVSIAVFENNIPISLEVFPIGSTDITHDIALGMKIPLEDAEKMKRGNHNDDTPKKKLDEIIRARLTDIFELIDAHLKKIGRNELLPAGVIITGGGSGIASIDDIARVALKLPARKASYIFDSGSKISMQDSTWAVAYGLCILGLTQDEEPPLGLRIVKNARQGFIAWIKQFLP